VQIWRQKIDEKMKFDQNAPSATRTITTTPYRTSQDEPPVREREEEKPTQKLQIPIKTWRRTATTESTGGNKSSIALMVGRNLPPLVHTKKKELHSPGRARRQHHRGKEGGTSLPAKINSPPKYEVLTLIIDAISIPDSSATWVEGRSMLGI
jgi:hypothetical protein